MQNLDTGSKQTFRNLCWCVGIALAVAGLVLVRLALAERDEIEQVEGERLATQARIVAANLEVQLEGAERLVQSIVGDSELWSGGTPGQAGMRLGKIVQLNPGITSLMIANERGIVVNADSAALVGSDIGASEYFTAARALPASQQALHLSAPGAAAVAGERHALRVTLAIRAPGGAFAGAVSAILEPQALDVLMASVLYAPGMWSSLANGDGRVITFVPARPELIGMNIARPGSFFSRHRATGQRSSVLTGLAYSTGERRMAALRTVQLSGTEAGRAPVVAVSRDYDDIFAGWWLDWASRLAVFLLVAAAAWAALVIHGRTRARARALNEQQQSELRALNERLHLATEAAELGVWEFDLASGKVSWDERMFALYGVDPEPSGSVDYAVWRGAVLPEDVPAAEAALRESIKDGCVFASRFRIRRHDEVRLIRAVALLRRNTAGEVIALIGVNEDITDQWRAEQALFDEESRNARLERMEVLGTIAGGIAHDFNNILHSLLGFSELAETGLRQGGDPQRVLAHLAEVATAGQRAKVVVRQLLAFSRGGAAHPEPVEVGNALRETAKIVSGLLEEDQQISVDADPDLPIVHIDPVHLRHVVLNATANAQEALNGCAGMIRVEAVPTRMDGRAVCASCHHEVAGDFLHIRITDNGAGMNEYTRGRAFDPFFSTKTPNTGAGMGLAVIHGLVHLHDGHLALSSVPGQGTELSIFLPTRPYASGQALS